MGKGLDTVFYLANNGCINTGKTQYELHKLTNEQQDIIRHIRNLHASNQPLNISAVRDKYPQLLLKTYQIKPFWVWKQAIEAAGINYRDEGQSYFLSV